MRTDAGTPEQPDDARERAIKPELSEGDLVKVAGASNQTEAEFIQALLRDEGVPSTTRRTRGFDVPDFLAAGPRDILVPSSGAAVARDVLLQADVASPAADATAGVAAPGRVLAGVLIGVAIVALIVWLGTELLA